ncbi:unnamed protein product [Symbiodinium sp. CCMP2592]|nr:unnamed protein product [Symbiodinium sp. CCMP2592]
MTVRDDFIKTVFRSRPAVSRACFSLGERRSFETMSHKAPPLLKWYICQLCRASPDHPCSVAHATVSKADLMKISSSVQQSMSQGVKGKRCLVNFLQRDEAQSFRNLTAASSNGDDNEVQLDRQVEHYNLDVIPMLLQYLGMDMSFAFWADVLACLENRLIEEHEQLQLQLQQPLLNRADSGLSSCSGSSSTIPGDGSLACVGLGGVVPVVPWFDQLSREELVQKLFDRDLQITSLKQQLDRSGSRSGTRAGEGGGVGPLRLSLKKEKKKCKKLELSGVKKDEKISVLQQKINSLKTLLIERRGTARKLQQGSDGDIFCDRGWLTASGIIQLAIKRNLGHCSSEHLQLLIQQDVSRWTVSRSFVALMLIVYLFMAVNAVAAPLIHLIDSLFQTVPLSHCCLS